MPDSPSTTGCDDRKPALPRWRKTLKPVLYVLLLAAAIFAALQIHDFWQARQGEQPAYSPQAGDLDTGALDTGQAQTQPGYYSSPTAGSAGMPMLSPGMAGLTRFKGDPGGFPPPKGAKGRNGFEQKAAGMVLRQRQYDYSGEPSAVVEHYNSVLSEAGFVTVGSAARKIARSQPAADWPTLVYTKGSTCVTVALRNGPPDARIATIVMTVTYPQ